jgi:hypothetical protein
MATFGDARRIGVMALVLAALAPRAYAGNPSPADVATARELYKVGADALDAGNSKVAAEKLSQAWSLVQTPVIGTDLARAQRSLGHLVEAREAALAVERLPIAHDETARSTEARADAEKIANELAPRIPHVKVVPQGVGAGHVATVKLDGSVVPEAALSVARQANPGPHTATIDTDDGRHAEGVVTLAEGETKEISLVVPSPVSAPTIETKPVITESHPPPPAAMTSLPEARHTSPVVWIGVATAGVGLVTGALAGAFALSEASVVKNNCFGASTTGDGKIVCPTAFAGDLSAANTLGVVSTVGFVTLGVGAAMILVGLAVSGKSTSTKRAHVAPWVGPLSGGVVGVF